MINYEDEISEMLFKSLKSIYGLIDDSVIFRCFYLRFLIENNDRKIDKMCEHRMLVDFLIKELNLPLIGDKLIYKNIPVLKYFSNYNCLENVIVNWQFRASLYKIKTSKGLELDYDEYMAKEIKKLITHGRNKSKLYKNTKHYNNYLRLNSLMLLNKHYKVKLATPFKIQFIEYPEYHNYFTRTLEEKYISEIHSAELTTYNTNNISESDLEKYIIKHLNLIEEGLKYVDSQVIIKDGRIDILALDKSNMYVIIELKVDISKELIWQCVYYPMQFKEEQNVKAVRMIVVSSDLPDYIVKPLKQINGVEILKVLPLVELGKMKDIKLIKVN